MALKGAKQKRSQEFLQPPADFFGGGRMGGVGQGGGEWVRVVVGWGGQGVVLEVRHPPPFLFLPLGGVHRVLTAGKD